MFTLVADARLSLRRSVSVSVSASVSASVSVSVSVSLPPHALSPRSLLSSRSRLLVAPR